MDNQLIGTTQPFMLYVTPLSNENEVAETGPAVQVNAVKLPSKSALTNIYKVGQRGSSRLDPFSRGRCQSSVQGVDGRSPVGLRDTWLIRLCKGIDRNSSKHFIFSTVDLMALRTVALNPLGPESVGKHSIS